MSWGEAYRRMWRRYAVFEGRATRAEYWWPVLVNLAILAPLQVLAFAATRAFLVLDGLYVLAGIIPGLALSVRRLHDTDRSGWWWLIGLVPFVAVILLILTVLPGTPGANRYGAPSM